MEKLNFNGLQYCAKRFAESGGISGRGNSKWGIYKGVNEDVLFKIKYNDEVVMEYYKNQGFILKQALNDIEINKIVHIVSLQIPDIKEICLNRDDYRKNIQEIISEEKLIEEKEEIDPNFDFTR